jgi:threonine dehydrogenase-like Zn-dependent dehydrogenase
MWAYRLLGPSRIGPVQVPTPSESQLASNQVLLRFRAGGICGSDLPYFRGEPAAAVPLEDESSYSSCLAGASLHEVAGEVLASSDPAFHVGANVVGWASGMDALAELVVCNTEGLVEYDAALAPTAAVMLQPLACVLYAVEQMHSVQGARAAVIGLGPIGVLFAHVLKTSGAREVTGVDRVDRSDVKDAFLMDQVVVSSAARWAVQGNGASTPPDLVVEAIGHQVGTLAAAITATAVGGEIYYFGVPDDHHYPFPMWDFLRKNLTLVSGVTPFAVRQRVLRAAQEYLRRHPELVDHYVTSVFPYAEAQGAFEVASTPARGRLKVVITA